MSRARMQSSKPQTPNIEALQAITLAEARCWIGTPYRHQGRLQGHAIDCAGLILEVGLALDLFDFPRTAFADRFRAWQGYGRLPNPARMRGALAAFLQPIKASEARGGDAMWVRWERGPAMHLAILADDGPELTMIHAHGLVGVCVEHGFRAEWPDRVESWWRYPALAR